MKLCLLFVAVAAFGQTADIAVVSGKTLSVSGQPLRKSVVTLRPAGNRTPGTNPEPYGTTTDAQGRFSFEGVDPGTYMLSAQHVGYLPSGYKLGKALQFDKPFTIAAGQHIADLTLELLPESTISGRVFDEDGDPVPGLSVQVLRSLYVNPGHRQYLPNGSAVSDDNGDFRIRNLQPGRYILSVSPERGIFGEPMRRAGAKPGEPELRPVTSYYPNAPDMASATPIEVSPGQQASGMNVQVHKSPVYHIKGKVSGTIPPDTQAHVALAPKDDELPMAAFRVSANMAKDGSFDLPGVAPGAYDVAVITNGRALVLVSVPVQVGSENIENLVLNAAPPASLAGVLHLEANPLQPPRPIRFHSRSFVRVCRSWRALALP